MPRTIRIVVTRLRYRPPCPRHAWTYLGVVLIHAFSRELTWEILGREVSIFGSSIQNKIVKCIIRLTISVLVQGVRAIVIFAHLVTQNISVCFAIVVNRRAVQRLIATGLSGSVFTAEIWFSLIKLVVSIAVTESRSPVAFLFRTTVLALIVVFLVPFTRRDIGYFCAFFRSDP